MSVDYSAAGLVAHIRAGLGHAGIADVRVHYGGQKRGRAHRFWLSGNVLGVDRSTCMVIGAEQARDLRHASRFVAQVLDQAAGMALANRFRP